MESFMSAPMGEFAEERGDADFIPAPHRMSIPVCELGGKSTGPHTFLPRNRVIVDRTASFLLRCFEFFRATAMPSTRSNRSGKSRSPRSEKKTLVPSGAAIVRIGPAGWSYPDWAGYVYPSRRPKGFHEAAYLAEFFDTIEINTSFYQPLRPDHAASWVERVSANPRFVFTAKLWQRFTHEGSPAAPAATTEDERAVRAGFDVLAAAGKLGAVLLQLPFSFHRTRENLAYLLSLLKRFGDYPLVVEVRHASWDTPETFDMLHERSVGFCNIDQPVIGRAIEPSAEVTSTIGYARLHGRRYDTWFSDDPQVPAHERYNYLYSTEELAPWGQRIQKIANHSSTTFVITNNHYQGKAVLNALQLISILKGSKVKVPEPLRQHYPQLDEIADAPPAEPTLFPMEERNKNV
jgi:uncharacterized protein YecE (DUF72 family)